MGECTACYPGYQVDSGKCVIGKPADSNCKTFSGQVCTECYKGFYYNADSRICKKVNALCKTSISSGACTSCYPGYSLNQMNGNCEVSIKDPNCRSFNSDGSCSSCSSRYYVNPNGKCGSVNPLCKDYKICNQILYKGRKIMVVGRLQTRSWEGQDGNKRYTTEIVASDVVATGSPRSQGEQELQSTQKSEPTINTDKPAVESKKSDDEINLDDIPF